MSDSFLESETKKMRTPRPYELACRTRSRLLPSSALLFLALAACDGDATQLVEEINAAREGCTEEDLKASTEACVQMFERYAEMGEDAMETYIGGLRAMDEALQRRGGVRFDTAGLARVFSDSLLDVTENGVLEPQALERQYSDDESTYAGPAGRWTDGAASWQDDLPETFSSPEPAARRDPQPAGNTIRSRRPAPSSERAAPARGRLLPPEDRLRRPWIGDEAPTDEYVEESEPRSARPAARRAPETDPWPERPDAHIPPQRRE